MPSKCLRDAFEMFLSCFVNLFSPIKARKSWNRKAIEEIIFNFTP